MIRQHHQMLIPPLHHHINSITAVCPFLLRRLGLVLLLVPPHVLRRNIAYLLGLLPQEKIITSTIPTVHCHQDGVTIATFPHMILGEVGMVGMS